MLSRSLTPLARQALRVRRSVAPTAQLPPAFGRRTNSSSSSGGNGLPSSWPPLPPGFEKVTQRPSAIEAIRNLVEIMKKNGIDMSSGEKPSMFQMMKLASNSEIREATGKLMHELKEAGMDVSPQALQKFMQAGADSLKDPKK
ncbi:uncharacterized protein PFL1_00441 [Pseudozyma flocculosa PF-1]|uniref:Uncharacterized protein n=1 Tax=Pseudozyma flocculosa TaxID=84751 RepID=A0A5C3ETF0_9BASI|nr:uncharacterized protein PFL1_00441 [Pseudozyma flocculosa PF-1]EPQ32244.1 hypothetical protein PFL1_00441 [Pseudozyma flocculosa PF-1]SPO34806.1 uncharacterized protein PSFLO_00277 [Pseudozyma flocculosa]